MNKVRAQSSLPGSFDTARTDVLISLLVVSHSGIWEAVVFLRLHRVQRALILSGVSAVDNWEAGWEA